MVNGEDNLIVNVLRYDNYNLDNIKLKKTEEGYLEGYAIATRTGVFNYIKSDGSIQRELRTAEEVFKKDAVDSFKLLPITNEHPPVAVNSSNIKELAVGFTGENIKRQDSYLLTKLKITDKKTIEQINSGKRGLSYGYKVDLIKSDGVYNGEKYDYIQTNIKGNHLAIVYEGRAGDKAKLNLDEQEAVCNLYDLNNNDHSINMKKITLNNNTYEVEEALYLRFDSLEANNAQLQKTEKFLKEKIDSLEGERDALKDKIDKLIKKDNSEEINIKVKERIALEKQVSEFFKNGEDLSKLSNMDIKAKVINFFSPEFKCDEKSDEYINARFDAIIEMKNDINLAKNMQILGFQNNNNNSKILISNQDLQIDLIKRSKNLKTI